MKSTLEPIVFWYTKYTDIKSLDGNKKTDVVIVGGGMAGISAAHAFAKRGRHVILLEKSFCGGGASGKSSGFITPNCELSLAHFVHTCGAAKARAIWEFILRGGHLIKQNIAQHAVACDYIENNALLIANSSRAFKDIAQEADALHALGFQSTLIQPDSIRSHVASDGYYGGLVYPNSFGIKAYEYCQQMKQVLRNQGVEIYEETPVTRINAHEAVTPHGTVTAKQIVVCADRFIPQFTPLKDPIFQVQSFLALSRVLDEKTVRALFPNNSYMVWDSDLVYTYYRMTIDNRFMIGGGAMWASYTTHAYYEYLPIVKKFNAYLKKKFPTVTIDLEYIWPGLIGVSKDMAPIAGVDKNCPSIYYIGACAGLPIAATLGEYSAEHLLEGRTDMDDVFSPYRPFFIGSTLQHIIGKRAAFSLSNLRSLYQ
ncbi:MAG: FAD-binding oxidoreductase [Candidatus Babeliales bacterium]